MRLDADLITLSACDSGARQRDGRRGPGRPGPRLPIRRRRSVVASLWEVADVSTARFMKYFYSHLHDGKSKEEALRAAQIDMIREKSGSTHPFHWAAFELFGDWR
ncbi:MAG TPA: CHAT domain-containing protein [Thermoanaerobaculia bacterium]|nr:CHAT domain-containing protein [Thermoanaerobaculia bacterium]